MSDFVTNVVRRAAGLGPFVEARPFEGDGTLAEDVQEGATPPAIQRHAVGEPSGLSKMQPVAQVPVPAPPVVSVPAEVHYDPLADAPGSATMLRTQGLRTELRPPVIGRSDDVWRQGPLNMQHPVGLVPLAASETSQPNAGTSVAVTAPSEINRGTGSRPAASRLVSTLVRRHEGETGDTAGQVGDLSYRSSERSATRTAIAAAGRTAAGQIALAEAPELAEALGTAIEARAREVADIPRHTPVHVHIGRIEISSPSPQAPPRPQPEPQGAGTAAQPSNAEGFALYHAIRNYRFWRGPTR